MKTYLGILLGFLLLLSGHQAHGQDEFFHELSLEKLLFEDEQWELVAEVDWKNLYNEPGWRRWGVSVAGVRKIANFDLLGGINGYYTFNRSITNFFELRPWMAVSYRIALSPRISLRQRLKAEWRLFYEEGDAPREDYSRIRYRLGIDIPLSSGAHEASWSIRPNFEWYIIRDPATFERFPNERDYGLMFIRRLENDHELTIGYKVETFYNTENERGNGHIITLGYAL